MNLFRTILKDRSLKPMLSFVLFVLVLVLLYLVYGRIREGVRGARGVKKQQPGGGRTPERDLFNNWFGENGKNLNKKIKKIPYNPKFSTLGTEKYIGKSLLPSDAPGTWYNIPIKRGPKMVGGATPSKPINTINELDFLNTPAPQLKSGSINQNNKLAFLNTPAPQLPSGPINTNNKLAFLKTPPPSPPRGSKKLESYFNNRMPPPSNLPPPLPSPPPTKNIGGVTTGSSTTDNLKTDNLGDDWWSTSSF